MSCLINTDRVKCIHDSLQTHTGSHDCLRRPMIKSNQKGGRGTICVIITHAGAGGAEASCEIIFRQISCLYFTTILQNLRDATKEYVKARCTS
jgi:hypothetical protein